MQYIELKDGSFLEAPDDASDADIRSRIEKIQGSKTTTNPVDSFKDVWSEALRQGLGREQSIGSRPEVAAARDTPVGQALEIPFYVAAPEIGMPRLAASLGRILPRAGKYITSAIQNAIPQSAIAGGSALLSDGDITGKAGESAAISAPFSAIATGISEGSPVTRGISKALMAAGMGGLGYGGAKAFGQGDLVSALTGAGLGLASLKGHSIIPNAKKDVLEGLEGTNYKESLDAAKRLGLKYLTPAEASGSEYAGAVQGALGKTPEGSKELLKAGKQRLKSEKQSIENLKTSIFNPVELSVKKNELYDVANTKTVPQEKLDLLKNSKTFKSAMRKVEKKPAYSDDLAGVPENSIKRLDYVKQAMDDMIEASPKKEAKLIRKRQKDLMGVMDEASPEYAAGRSLAERETARTKVEDFFDKRKETGSNFAKFLASKKNYNMLNNNLRNVPEAQQQLKDMKLVFENLINTPTAKIAAAQASSGMSKARSSSQDWKAMLKEALSGGRYDKAAVELITNPKWADEVSKMSKISNEQKLLSEYVNLSGKALSGKSGSEK